MKTLNFARCRAPEAAVGRRLHRKQRDNLKQMVLNDIAQAAGGLVESRPHLNAETLRERDLYARDEVPVPDRLQEGVGKAKVDEVHDRCLAQERINAENCVLRERPTARRC